MRTVRPPPGVSSSSTLPPIASMNPRATASPRPTPARVLWSPRRWNGWNTRSPIGRVDAGTAVDDPEVDAAGHLGRLRSRTCAGDGDQARALATMLASARSRSAGSTEHRRQRLGHAHRDLGRVVLERAEGGGHDVFEVHGAGGHAAPRRR